MSNELKPLHFDADYTMEEALAEAKRCLNCPKPLCRMGCPIENEIPRFILAIHLWPRMSARKPMRR